MDRTVRGEATQVALDNVTPLLLPWVSDPWGRLRPPVSVEAMRLSAELAGATYGMAVDRWMRAGWRDVTIQVDGDLTAIPEKERRERRAIGWLADQWRLHRIRAKIRQRNPVGQVIGALRQIERSDTGKVLVMLHPAPDGHYVVAVSFMGTGGRFYDWFSNFRMVAENGVHKGFLQLTEQFERNETEIDFPETARALGVERLTLRHILEEMKSPNSRFALWLTGHSQGGALMQVYAMRKIHLDGVLMTNLVGYGFASPSVLDGATTLDPAAFPLYHVVNSDDVVPRMGGQMHLGALLVYQTTDELRKRCYAWPMDAESVRRRVLVSRAVAWMRDTPSSIEAVIAYLNVLREHDPEEIIAGLGLVEAKLPVRRLIAAADTRVDALLRYIARHLGAAYLSITGERLNPSRVAEIQTLLRALVDDMGVKAFSDALTQLTSQPHSMTAKGGAAMSPYAYIVLHGMEELVPAIWQAGRPPQLLVAGVARAEEVRAASGLYNRRKAAPPRRTARTRYQRLPRSGGARRRLPTLTPGTMRPSERVIRPRG